MLTYTETKGHQPFNWWTALRRAQEGLSTTADRDNMLQRASQWTLCACGNQCSAIPRIENSGAPEDVRLSTLGMDFYSQVRNARWQAAMFTLTQIELRSAQILTELEQQKQPHD